MIKLKPIHWVVIAIVAIGALWYFGFLDDIGLGSGNGNLSFFDNGIVPTDSENLGLGKSDIYYIFCVATGKNLNRDTTYDFIDKLNMEVYGSNSHYTTIAQSFRAEYSSWTKVMDSGFTDGVALAWTQGNDAVSVITSTKLAFRTMYGYETLTLTAKGDVNDYNDFYWFVLTS